MSNSVTLVEKIRQLQEERGYNEVTFAAMLGISRAQWWLMKKRERRPSAAFMSALMQVFPELEPDVLAYMKALVEKPRKETLTVG
jgi:transcriptional regulator with XRE-family HTH domain